jgi:putative lipoic acid-binding regulatory protein
MEKIPVNTGQGCRPRIDYPCVWQYKVIVTEAKPVRTAISEHLGDAPYSLSESKRSSGGRYISLNLELTVHSDYHRLRLYEVLSAHPAVKVVL